MSNIIFAANWVCLSTSHDGTKNYVDLDNNKINQKNGTIQLWCTHIKPDKSYVIGLSLINYRERTYVNLQATAYSSMGKVVSHDSFPSNIQHIIPGTAFEALVKDILNIYGVEE